mgnify:CR=1 FL=1
MNKNNGIALVSVLLVTFAIMIIGMGTLMLTNSNLMVSQNLVSHSVARTNAEAGIDAVIVALQNEVAATGRLPASMPQPSVLLPGGGTVDYRLTREPVWDGNIALIEVEGLGPRNARYMSEAVIAFTSDGVNSGVRPFTGVVQACDYVDLRGSGQIDSFDSRTGSYDAGSPGRSAHVQLLGSDGLAELRGNAPIYGNVYSTGTFLATGSSAVHGDIHATGDISMTASTNYAGNVITAGRLEISNTARIAGSVSANGDIRITNGATINGNATAGGDITFTNTGARVRQNALAGGTVSYTHNNHAIRHVEGVTREHGSPSPNAPVPPMDCDPIGLPSYVERFSGLPTDNATLTAGWPTTQFRITPDNVSHYDDTHNVKAWTVASEFTPQQAHVFDDAFRSTVYKFNDVDFASNGRLEIAGGDVVMFVDGDFKIAGDAALTIAPDSSLTVFVTGTTELSGSFRMNDINVVNTEGVPAFAIFSSVQQDSLSGWQPKGVKLSGNGKLVATVYAPFTNVEFSGSGEIYGSVLGKGVSVTGNGRIHFDEALGDVEVGSGGEEVAGEAIVLLLSRR